MPSRLWIQAIGIVLAFLLATGLARTWWADRRDRAELAVALASAQKALAAATANQQRTDSTLSKQLSAIAAKKRSISSPSQIVSELSREIPLPEKLTLRTGAPSAPGIAGGVELPAKAVNENNKSHATAIPSDTTTQVVIPAQDLKPLFDFTMDCKACQAKLAAASSDLRDEQAKSAALGKERDAAVRVAKGGTLWRRAARAAKWFAIGAAAGALAAKAAH